MRGEGYDPNRPPTTWTMLDRLTGEIRTGTYTNAYADDDGVLFQWLEHNWSCDHNRAREWSRSAGEPELEVDSCMSMPDETRRFVLIRLVREGRVLAECKEPCT